MSVLNRIVLIVVVMLLCPVVLSAATPQAENLSQRLMLQLPPDAQWGLTVADAKSGKELLHAGDTGIPLVPASLVKLLTAGAALETEEDGQPVTMATEILYDGRLSEGTLYGNIYLRGNGNCLLTTDDLRKAARLVKAKGIGMVKGRIVADVTRFDIRGLERSRVGAGYAPPGALGLDLHTLSVTAEPADPDTPPRVKVEPPNAKVRFASAARTVRGSSRSIEMNQIDDAAYRLSGDIVADSQPVKWRFPLTDPARYAAQSFSTILNEAGIRVEGEAGTGKTPDNATFLGKIPGPAMERYVSEMNMNSLNVAADNLLLSLGGAAEGFPATKEKGLNVLKKHLARHGISDDEVQLADGSGLLPGNRLSSRALTRYLSSVAHRPWFPAFLASLPQAGVEGTMKKFGYRNQKFRVKTGRLENGYGLAGYGVDGKGREIAFTYIVNHPAAAKMNLEQSGIEVMKYLGTEVLQ
jgi:D-alanyl-D-alanine carboxypeptidase/D-alanyl-D-alanine-endopeptidase (penicillin-binding protein 4)